MQPGSDEGSAGCACTRSRTRWLLFFANTWYFLIAVALLIVAGYFASQRELLTIFPKLELMNDA
jgi:hypothetical protein